MGAERSGQCIGVYHMSVGGVRGDPNRNSCLRYFVDFLLQPLLFQNPTCPSAPPSATARWSIGGGGLVSARSSSS